MRIDGEAPELFDVLFPQGLVPQILKLIVDTWRMFRRPDDDEDEPKITNRFVLALQTERRRRGARFRVEPHTKDVEHLDPATGRGYVEIDICIPHGYDNRCYFGIEAKKLNVKVSGGGRQSKAGEYAGPDGMGCFVSGRYAPHQGEGAMIGYVMDGNCENAKKSISAAINKRASELHVPNPHPLAPARHLPDNPDAFETEHDLPERDKFTLHHVLLAA
ncbi:MAG: hypothetical protein KAV82_00675 [Phycisphaerae bacterium]|nr:hypothetical protein [Phycisphaerae bacterium]